MAYTLKNLCLKGFYDHSKMRPLGVAENAFKTKYDNARKEKNVRQILAFQIESLGLMEKALSPGLMEDNSCTKNIVLEVLELESFPVGVRS